MYSHYYCDQVEVSGSAADPSSTLDPPIRSIASVREEGLTPAVVPSIALEVPSAAGIMEEGMATPFDSILDLDVLSLEVAPSSSGVDTYTCCQLPGSDTKLIQFHDPVEIPTQEYSKCVPYFSDFIICAPSPESTDSFDIDGSAELSDSESSSDTSLMKYQRFCGIPCNDFTAILPPDVRDPDSSSENVGSSLSDIQPPPPPEQNTTLESSKCRAFSQPLCEPSPGTEIMSTDSFNIESSAALLESNTCDVSSSGVLANDFTVIFTNDVTDPNISSEQVESIVLDIQPPPSYDDVECTSPAYSDEAELATKPLSSETANKRPARISMLPKFCLPQPVTKSLNEELLGRPGSEQDDQKHVAPSVKKDSDSGIKKPVLLGKLLHVTSDATFFPNIGTGKLEAWIPVFNPSFVSSVVFRTSIKTTWRDFMEPTMGVIPPRGNKIIVAHADPSKHPKDIGKSLANEVIKLEMFPTTRIATKFSEFFSLWKKREGPVEVIRMSDFTVSSTPRKVEVPTTVNDGLLMKQNGNEMKTHVGVPGTPGCKISGIPTIRTRKPIAKDIGESDAVSLGPMTEPFFQEVNNEDLESRKVEDGTTATETSACVTSNEDIEQVSAETDGLPAAAKEEDSKSWSWFRSWF